MFEIVGGIGLLVIFWLLSMLAGVGYGRYDFTKAKSDREFANVLNVIGLVAGVCGVLLIRNGG
jgi:hypothetical protein